MSSDTVNIYNKVYDKICNDFEKNIQQEYGLPLLTSTRPEIARKYINRIIDTAEAHDEQVGIFTATMFCLLLTITIQTIVVVLGVFKQTITIWKIIPIMILTAHLINTFLIERLVEKTKIN